MVPLAEELFLNLKHAIYTHIHSCGTMSARVVRVGPKDGMGPNRWWFQAIEASKIPFPLSVPCAGPQWEPCSRRMRNMSLTSAQRLLLGAYWREICDEIGPGATLIQSLVPSVERAHLRPCGLFASKEIGGVNEDALLERPVKCVMRPEAGTPAWWHMIATTTVRPVVGITNLHMLITLTHSACYGVVEAVAGTTVPLSGIIPMYNTFIRAGGAVTVQGRPGIVYYVGKINGHDQPDWIGVSLSDPPPPSMFVTDSPYYEIVCGSGGKFEARNSVCARPHMCAPCNGLHYDVSDKIAMKIFGYGMRGDCGLVHGREGSQAVQVTLMTATAILTLFDKPHSDYVKHRVTPEDKAAVVAVTLLGKDFHERGPGTAVAYSKGRTVILAYPTGSDIHPYEYETIMLLLRAEARRNPTMKLYVASGDLNCRRFVRTVVERLIERDDSGCEPRVWPEE